MLCFCSSNVGANDREHTLKIYNWADYIDESLIPEFEQWYEQQTGEPVKIIYQTFDINETMLSKIELGHEDFDVVCPSDYIIERMLKSDLLLPIDKNFGDTPNYIDGNLAPYIKNMFNHIEGFGKNANDYSVGFMWGTTGLIYNPKFITKDEASSWYILQDKRIEGKLLMKEAFRDVYTSLLIGLNKEAIDKGEKNLDALCRDCSDESIAQVEEFLNSIKSSISGWEADFGKEAMTKERAWINLSWSGDAEWAIEEAAEVGITLDYCVPKEGSTVWFDGWVIPKYAQNVQAARYFINFMCKPENALRNMDAIGYVSCIGGQQILDAMSDPDSYEYEDARYFFGEEADSVAINPVMYPSQEIMDRCGMMHDNGEDTAKLLAMWSRVKGNNSSAITYIIIGVIIALAAGFGIYSKVSKNKRKKGKRSKSKR